MPAIKRITNDNSDVEAKVNYFIDRFNHHVLYGGTEWHMELENQLSMIEKILFQLTGDPDHWVVYIDNYLGHEYFNDPLHWKRYPAYENVAKVISAYKVAKNVTEKKQLLDQSSFQKGLERLREELSFHMPENLMSLLMSIFLCAEPLEGHEHIEKLNLVTKLMVSEGYFCGKSYNDLHEVINRIFYNRNEKSYGDRQFPFPAEVKKSGRKKYLNARSLENQISGFKSVMQRNPHHGIVVMRVFGSIRLPDDYEFRYNDVYFLGPKAKKILKIKATIPEQNKDFIEFFKDEDCFYLASNQEWFSYFNIKYRMREFVREQLEYVSAILHRSMEVDHTDSFITATRQWKFVGGTYSFASDATRFRSDQLDVLNNNNVYKALAACKKSPAAQLIFSTEPQLIRALKSGITADYWQYLEALIPMNLKGKKQIKEVVPKILLLNEKVTSDNRIFKTMIHAFDILNGGYSTLGVDIREISGIRRQLINKKVPVPSPEPEISVYTGTA